jgi:2-polyprenyl-3-methyl-5-hydroxy-6-metoxy-1,4-benzoquinol methylase
MDQAYFKDYYHLEREHWWFLVRRKILAERINSLLNRPKQIHSLNVGAATGTTSDMLMEFGEVMSIEYDEDCCRFTQGFLQTPIIQGSILELPFNDNQYDLVTAFDVIEQKNKDILKSLTYAKRIQKAILPSLALFPLNRLNNQVKNARGSDALCLSYRRLTNQ